MHAIPFDPRAFKKLCPQAHKAIYGRRYILPSWLVKEYPTQDEIQRHDCEFFLNFILKPNPESNSFKFTAATKAALYRYNKPTIFVDRDLGENLLETDLPGDMTTEHVLWPWPALRLVMPEKLLRAREKSISIRWLDICLLKEGEELAFSFLEEMALGLHKMYGGKLWRGSELEVLEDAKAGNKLLNKGGDVFFGSGTTDHKESIDYSLDDTTWAAAWTDRDMQEFISLQQFTSHASNTYLEPGCREAYDPTLQEQARHLSLNILLLLSHYPVREGPAEVLRKEKESTRAHKQKSELLRAKFLSELVTARVPKRRIPGNSSGQTKAAHWVRGHWHTYLYGKGRQERKLRWTFPYRTGDESTEQN